MNSRVVRIGLTAAMMFWPGWLFAADAEQAEGSWFALIFYAVNFLLFLWIVQRYGWPAISQFFRDRSRLIRETRGRAETACLEAEELATRAGRCLRQLDADKRALMIELDEETDYQVRNINQAARDAVNRIRHDTETTSLSLRDGAQRHLRQTMAEAAGRIARELVSRNFQPSDQDRLLRGFVEHMGEEARP